MARRTAPACMRRSTASSPGAAAAPTLDAVDRRMHTGAVLRAIEQATA